MTKTKPRKLTAAQHKQIAAEVKAAKRSDGKLTWMGLYAREAAEWGKDDGDVLDVLYIAELIRQLREWSDAARNEYVNLSRDLQAIEEAESAARGEFVYLTDEGVDRENVLIGGRTEESVDFWHRMLCAAGPIVGDRAESYGIDINARLGRAIY